MSPERCSLHFTPFTNGTLYDNRSEYYMRPPSSLTFPHVSVVRMCISSLCSSDRLCL